MTYLIKNNIREGFNEIVRAGDVLKFINFGILRLSPGKSYSAETGGREVALVVLHGKCTVTAGDERFENIGKRPAVFSGNAYAVTVPPQSHYLVEALSAVEIAVASTPSDLKVPAKLITPEMAKGKQVGRDNWGRKVVDIIDTDTEMAMMLVGETFSPPGNWSSSPPHRHDFDNLPEENDLEEIYFYQMKPKQGFALQALYTDDRRINEVYFVEHGDTLMIPEGYHPIAAAPGYQVYYLWVLAGRKRLKAYRDDPKHSWIKKQ